MSRAKIALKAPQRVFGHRTRPEGGIARTCSNSSPERFPSKRMASRITKDDGGP